MASFLGNKNGLQKWFLGAGGKDFPVETSSVYINIELFMSQSY